MSHPSSRLKISHWTVRTRSPFLECSRNTRRTFATRSPTVISIGTSDTRQLCSELLVVTSWAVRAFGLAANIVIFPLGTVGTGGHTSSRSEGTSDTSGTLDATSGGGVRRRACFTFRHTTSFIPVACRTAGANPSRTSGVGPWDTRGALCDT